MPSISLDLNNCTRHDHATWRLLLSIHDQNSHTSFIIRHAGSGGILELVALNPGVELAGRLGSRPKLTNSTCNVSARCACTYDAVYLQCGPRSPGIATTFTATRQLCYFRLREPTLQCVVFVSDVTECTRIPTTWMVGFCFALHGHEAQHICLLPEQWNSMRSGRDEQHGPYLWC